MAPARSHAGIVDQDIDAPEVGDHALDERGDRLVAGDVEVAEVTPGALIQSVVLRLVPTTSKPASTRPRAANLPRPELAPVMRAMGRDDGMWFIPDVMCGWCGPWCSQRGFVLRCA